MDTKKRIVFINGERLFLTEDEIEIALNYNIPKAETKPFSPSKFLIKGKGKLYQQDSIVV